MKRYMWLVGLFAAFVGIFAAEMQSVFIVPLETGRFDTIQLLEKKGGVPDNSIDVLLDLKDNEVEYLNFRISQIDSFDAFLAILGFVKKELWQNIIVFAKNETENYDKIKKFYLEKFGTPARDDESGTYWEFDRGYISLSIGKITVDGDRMKRILLVQKIKNPEND